MTTKEAAFELEVPVQWPANTALFTLWLAFLDLSPSYRLAHLSRTEELKRRQRNTLPSDFDAVLKVYDDFGDVRGLDFEDWWVQRGLKLCGDIGVDPRVSKIASLEHGVHNGGEAGEQIINFLESDWIKQGMQNSAVVAIPLSLPKSKIAKQIAHILDAAPKDMRKKTSYKPKYELAVKRNNGDTLLKYLKVLITRAALPDAELWRVGAASGISDTYSPELDPDQDVAQGEATYDRMMLTIVTSRALLRARMISENAARGIFPSHKKCDTALEIDLDYVRSLYWADG